VHIHTKTLLEPSVSFWALVSDESPLLRISWWITAQPHNQLYVDLNAQTTAISLSAIRSRHTQVRAKRFL
jgi:hypothetical protein